MKQEEFEHIAPKLRTVMFQIGYSFFENKDDADDVAQEGLVTMWKYAAQIEPGRNHEALAVRIAKHCCMDLMRRRKRITVIGLDGKVDDLSAEPSPHEVLEATELKTALQEALDRLKPGEKQLFRMQQIEGLSPDEIAEQNHISKASIKSMVSVARKKIFNELKRRMES